MTGCVAPLSSCSGARMVPVHAAGTDRLRGCVSSTRAVQPSGPAPDGPNASVGAAGAAVVLGALGAVAWLPEAESNVARMPSRVGNCSGPVSLIRNTALYDWSGALTTITWYSPTPLLPQPVKTR